MEVAVGIVLNLRNVRIEIDFRRAENQSRRSENAAVSAEIATEDGQSVAFFLQKTGGEGIFAFHEPVVFRMGFVGDFPEKCSVQPDPGAVVDLSQIELDVPLREVREIEDGTVEEISVIPFESVCFGIEVGCNLDFPPGGIVFRTEFPISFFLRVGFSEPFFENDFVGGGEIFQQSGFRLGAHVVGDARDQGKVPAACDAQLEFLFFEHPGSDLNEDHISFAVLEVLESGPASAVEEGAGQRLPPEEIAVGDSAEEGILHQPPGKIGIGVLPDAGSVFPGDQAVDCVFVESDGKKICSAGDRFPAAFRGEAGGDDKKIFRSVSGTL